MLEYARLLAPGIVHKIEHPYSNDFSGLSGDDCRELGQILAENIESGEAERWWEHYQDHPQWTEMFGSCPSRESFLSWMSGFRDFLLECDGLTISRALEWSPPTHWANAFSAHDPALEHVSNNQLAREVAERLGEIQELVESAFERVHQRIVSEAFEQVHQGAISGASGYNKAEIEHIILPRAREPQRRPHAPERHYGLLGLRGWGTRLGGRQRLHLQRRIA